MDTNKVVIIGFGNHAKRIYHPIIKNLPHVEIVGIVDLIKQKYEVESYISENNINCETLFVTENAPELSTLVDFTQKLGANSIVISTDPESHVFYAKWAFQQGLSVVMDKPIHAEDNTAHDQKAAKNIFKKHEELEKELALCRKKFPFIVCEVLAQRRFHPAYQLVRDTVREVYEKTGCPITYYYSFHNDGQWRLPQELKEIDYHGFNKGYGKASHSGYHFFDLLNWLSSCYRKDLNIDSVTTMAWPNYPENYLEQVNSKTLEKVFKKRAPEFSVPKESFKGFGEVDVMSTIRLQALGHTVTHAQIDLLHSGITARSWQEIGKRSLYKHNGRVRHEQHYISMGPFLSITLTSWQSRPFHSEQINSRNIYKPGHEFNLDITICRNSKLIGGKQAVTMHLDEIYKPELQDYSRGHQEDARRVAIQEFFDMQTNKQIEGVSSLETHKLSSLLMSSVYESLALEKTVNNNMSKI